MGRREQLGGSKQLRNALGTHHPSPLQGGIEDIVITDQCPGVGGGGLGAGTVTTGLDHHHRLHAGRHAQAAHEAASVLDALDIEQDALGFGILGEIVEDIAKVDICRIAEGGDGGETDPARLGPVEDGGTQRTGLGNQCHATRQSGILAEGGIHADLGADQAQAVGAKQTQLIVMGDLQHATLQHRTLAIPLTKTGGNDDRGTHPMLTTGLDDIRYGAGRSADHRQVDGRGDLADGGVAGHPLQGLALGVDGVELTMETTGDQVFKYQGANGIGPVAGTEHSDGFWGKKMIEVMRAHV